MRPAALIINPFASAVDEHRIALVERTLARYADVEVHLTEHRGHATELAEQLAPRVEAIFVFSGDGGFNEVMNGIGADAPPVGCIPGGGTSVFPRGLGLPRDPIAAAEILGTAFEEGRTRRITLGRVNGRRFLFNSGVFFDAELVRRIEAQRSQAGRPGDVAFVGTLMKLIGEHRGRFDPVAEIEGAVPVAFVMVANTDPYTFLGAVPIHVAPHASLEGGLDVIAPTKVRPPDIPRLLRYVMTGRRRPRSVIGLHDVEGIRVRCLRPLALQADGEDLGDVEEVVFEAERGAVTILSP